MYWFKCLVPSYQLISHIPYQDLVSAVENVSIQKESEPQAVQKKKKKTISKKKKEIRDGKLPGWLAGDGRKQQRQRQWTGEWRRREAKKQRSAVNRNRKAAAAAMSESEKQRRQQRSAESQRSSSAMWGFWFRFRFRFQPRPGLWREGEGWPFICVKWNYKNAIIAVRFGFYDFWTENWTEPKNAIIRFGSVFNSKNTEPKTQKDEPIWLLLLFFFMSVCFCSPY